MTIKTVPVVGLCGWIPVPVGGFKVFENDSRFRVFFVVIVPNVIIAPLAAGFGAAGPLEPGVLVRSVVEDQFGDHFEAFGMGGFEKSPEIGDRSIIGVDIPVVSDIIAVIP